MVMIIVWITILMCALGAIALYIEYVNKVKKNYEEMKLNGAIYEEYIS